jgi:outer membrane biosynthesis protein TonB
MNLGYFKLTVFLTQDDFTLEVFAGGDRNEVDDPTERYRLPLGPQKDIVREVLLRLEAALKTSQRGIDLKVKGKAINRDKTFPLPAAPVPSVIEIELADEDLTSRRVDPIVPLPDVKPPAKPGVPKPKRKHKPKPKTPDDTVAEKTHEKPSKPEPEPKPEDATASKKGRGRKPKSSTAEPKTSTRAKRAASTRKPKSGA